MSPAEQDALLKQFGRTRDIALRNRLASEFLYIAETAARRYAGRGIEYDDLYQVASLALIKALNRFDGSLGIGRSPGSRFIAYAVLSITGEVKNHFRDRLRLMRIPRRNSEALKQIDAAREALAQQLGRMPRVDEIAGLLGSDPSDILGIIESGIAARPASLDQGLTEEDDGVGMRLGREDPALELVENQQFLNQVIETLPPFERTVLTRRYRERRSQRDIAREHHVSQMYISNVERRILERFRASLRA